MRKAVPLFLLVSVFLFSACGRPAETNVSETLESSAVTQIQEPITAEYRLSANDTYGKSGMAEDILVRDESVCYRTEDSYRLEPIAVQAALEMLRGSLIQPDSLQIKDCVVSGCADDGDCTYYDVSFSVSYTVGSGERIDSGEMYSVGVRKSDETSFDASESIGSVRKQYSIFRMDKSLTTYTSDGTENDVYRFGAGKIALSHLKHPKSGKVLSVSERDGVSSGTLFVYDVLCEGENDFSLRIPDVYTAYLNYDNGKIVEIDPFDPEANIF